MNFDIAITSFKRPELTVAAVLSCLRQGSLVNKVIVVDDASGDNTGTSILALGDPRIIYFSRVKNGGIAAARRDAFGLSTADWTISIDSDHELVPGAVERLSTLISSSNDSPEIVGARYRWDTGVITPLNYPTGRFGYRERVVYSAQKDNIGSDYLCTISRRLRTEVLWEPLRTGLPDTLFQLDLAQKSDAIIFADVLGLEKTTGGHSWTRGNANARWARRQLDAPDGIRALRLIVERHGEALASWAPKMLGELFLQGAFYAVLDAQRSLARHWLAQSIKYSGLSRANLCLAPLTLLPVGFLRSCYRIRG